MAARAAAVLTSLSGLCVFLRLSALTVPDTGNTTVPDTGNTTVPDTGNTTGHVTSWTDAYTVSSTTVPAPTDGGTEAAPGPGPGPGPGLPLPEAGRLPGPPAHVGSVCPCDDLKDVCDVNCCCDKECVEEVAVFTHCSVPALSVRKQLCSREVASYSLRAAAGAGGGGGAGGDGGADGDGGARSLPELQVSLRTEKNPDIFCIHTQNRVDGLSHPSPAVPADSSFDSLFTSFSSSTPTWQQGRGHMTREELHPPAAYQYGDVMMTAGAGGIRGSFWLPASSITSDCVDFSPAVFLKEQSSSCYRPVVVEEDCRSLPALRMDTYTNVQFYSGKNQDAALVPVRLDSLAVRSLDGTLSPARPDGVPLLPVLVLPNRVLPDRVQAAVCANVVLKAVYVITFTPAGRIAAATVSLLLGFVGASRRRLEQEFDLTFVQEGREEDAVPYSGRPGYVVGLPLLSGRKTAHGVVRSVEPTHTLSLLQGAAARNCLAAPARRSAVRFGLDSVSGCTLRLEDAANCSLLSQVILDVLRGPDYPQFVAAFGSAPVDDPQDWLPIRTGSKLGESQSCRIPLSLHLEIEWTKYGSLVNPQAQIVSVREVIQTNATSLAALNGGGSGLSITSSVSFIAASATARPGFRATPTINAKLPFDFFFPFV